MLKQKNHTYYIENDHAGADKKLGALLLELFYSCKKDFEELVILCIGSDRITGDSLGPLVGHSLSKIQLGHTHIYGTLSQPVHALNLKETTQMLKQRHPNSLTIAVDASLGRRTHLGFLTVSQNALEPGLGVRKKLPPVGDISITGIVNVSGSFDHFLLQTTRLSVVVQMADSIASGLLMAHHEYFGVRRFPTLAFLQPEPECTRKLAGFVPFSALSSIPEGRI